MLIVSETDASGDLVLTAYSFDPKEIQALAQVVERLGVAGKGTAVPPDSHGRGGRRFIVPTGLIANSAKSLGGSFPLTARSRRCREVEIPMLVKK